LNIAKTMTKGVRNLGSGLGQALYCGGVKLIKRIPTPIDNSNTDLLTNETIKKKLDLLPLKKFTYYYKNE